MQRVVEIKDAQALVGILPCLKPDRLAGLRLHGRHCVLACVALAKLLPACTSFPAALTPCHLPSNRDVPSFPVFLPPWFWHRQADDKLTLPSPRLIKQLPSSTIDGQVRAAHGPHWLAAL
jgi:hypothetical protein